MIRQQFVGRSLVIATAAFGLSACATATIHRAYEDALTFGDTPRRGIVLFLHGCDGLGGPQLFAWQAVWVRHLVDLGFLVVAPDSFADRRPPQSCHRPFLNKEEIYQIRYRQTALAIDRLRSKYPTSSLLVWGHSEGGGVANLITAAVDGIITTGYQCGYRFTGRTWIRATVPVLAIMGTADPYVTDALRFTPVSSAERLCQMVLSPPKQRAVIVPGMAHAASLDWPQVREALDRFLDETVPLP